MAKAKATTTKAEPPSPTFLPKDARPKPIWGVVYLGVGMILFLAFFDYSPVQNIALTNPPEGQNLMGDFGVLLGYWAFRLLGRAAWLLPVAAYWISAMMFLAQAHKLNSSKVFALVVGVASTSILLTIAETRIWYPRLADEAVSAWATTLLPGGQGGQFGEFVYRGLLEKSFGLAPAIIFSLVLCGCAFLLIHDTLLSSGRLRQLWHAWREERARRKEARKQAARLAAERAVVTRAASGASAASAAGSKAAPPPKQMAGRGASPAPPPPPAPAPGKPAIKLGGGSSSALMDEPEPAVDDGADFPTKAGSGAETPRAGSSGGLKFSTPSRSSAKGETSGLKIVAAETTRKATQPLPQRRGDYVFPNLDLLREPATPPESADEDHQATAEALVRTLGEFGVKVTMGEVHTGPVITRYDLYPAAGVRVEKILNLDRNLALALKATSVRILAPVPGRGCVGIEVPNRRPMPVGIREILESEDWEAGKAEIPIALGREVSGRPLIADLTRMPHLLIAGSTGSGKTVCINSIVASLLFRSSPEELRFVMVDPKIVEMQGYNSLPHMLIPVVTDPKKVPAALKYLLREMERRYQIFAKLGVRNIAGFRARRAKDKEKEQEALEMEASLSPEERAAVNQLEVVRDEAIEIPDSLPYIVCIIDELADLMMVAPADVETCIARLAQLARAAGIHLIIATQRPSVNVITGIIKANLPSRIAFKVSAKVDSRTILDAGGADQLIGRGDLLFLPPGSSDLIRAQGAFVSDEEITGIVDFLKQNGEPKFDEVFQASVEAGDEEEGGGGPDDDLEDVMLPDAVEILRTTKRASTSMLQRRLRIGYNRAARIMEILEERGVVGPENGAQPREILKDLDSLKL